MRRFFLLLFFVLIACLAQTSEARKIALLVGVDSYVSVPSLKCCVNDMKTLKEALIKIGFEEDDIQILITGASDFKELPTKRNIEKNISKILTNAQPSDMVFLAFSGHGAQEGKNVYFCPPDVDADDLAGTCVSINNVMELFANKCNAKFKWIVVDACRNDPNREKKAIGGKGLQVIPTPPAGIALFQSCGEGEESWEDRSSGNGYFTKNFVAALSGEADSDHDGKLTFMEVCKWTMDHTKTEVMEAKKESQRPFSSGTFSDFTLTENINILEAKELAREAREALDDGDYETAVQKYSEALALNPNFKPWMRDQELARRLLNAQPQSNPKSIIVPDDFATIEEAYKNVKDGGFIMIKPGKYELSETLVVDRNVTFKGNTGQAKDVIIDSPSSGAFKITGGSPSFQYLTVTCGGVERSCFYITDGTPKLFHCDITSRKWTGITVDGEKANPQVESCIIKDCNNGPGVDFLDKGLGTFKDCEIYGSFYSGIQVGHSSNPKFYDCKIHDGKSAGVIVHKNGLGTFKDCEIYENSNSGIVVQESGNPIVTGCKIHDNQKAGIGIINSLGTFKDCDIYSNSREGIGAFESSNPTVTGCNIHNNKNEGVYINESSLGTFKNCDIYENSSHGIESINQGNPTVTGCKIHDHKSHGVHISSNATGTFNNNTLDRNNLNWFIWPGATVKGSGNTPPLPTEETDVRY